MELYIKPVGEIGTNCYIAVCGEGCVVVDPGAWPGQLLAFLQEKALTPACILLTHGHADHIGAVKGLAEAYGCAVWISEKDAPMLADPQKSLARMLGLPEQDYPLCSPRFAREGEQICVDGFAFEVLETPGHTPGGVSYRCGELLFTGDTLFRENIGRTDFEGGSYDEIIRSLQKLDALEGDLRVLPGHGPESSLAWERLHNPYMRTTSDDDFY